MISNSSIVRETFKKWSLLVAHITMHEPNLPFSKWSKFIEYIKIIHTLNIKMNEDEKAEFMKLTKVVGFSAITMNPIKYLNEAIIEYNYLKQKLATNHIDDEDNMSFADYVEKNSPDESTKKICYYIELMNPIDKETFFHYVFRGDGTLNKINKIFKEYEKPN